MKSTNTQTNYKRSQTVIFSRFVTFEDQFPELVEENSSLFIASPKILLVTHNTMQQALLTDMLSEMGCRIDIAEDGHEATAMSKKGYDLILMRIAIPKLDGLAATKAIRQQENEQHRTTIIAMTSEGELLEKGCFKAGIDDVYAKPITPDNLTKMVSYWLSHLLLRN
jgi:CheY-like chemotaxis protein